MGDCDQLLMTYIFHAILEFRTSLALFMRGLYLPVGVIQV